ncbi:type I-F CRISPR-associated helicase Cas3 [Xanthomonas hyacinthi]|uniref:Type I-F CRISPR-associated helicase Cas3 n=1 Tax=Xanthomonas hyacinthi TaxID=56455 RepID=A0A2S7EPV4_9XANT|nr:type I-F CRISPR-associated helicase Cas3f [Xanthomonas hyacinthi]KLD78543.1 CRISPR-associated protein Cas3 [Xanthomonas hyacinthi DSM 19077]PPU94811.1 type I-F CRISPR-associated helicase Cas3 [Xanthomonas hyacinthi]QGY76935.1 type I-F CRISPR-associated helicase Cas3 [Xanthomonas hyacinthi]
MNILLVSQCDKRALTETRRILDQFAERRGDRTWQTPITQAGLDTLRKLLRRTARKNTAVACHWIRGLDHSELLWIVGDTGRFNAQGAVPTGTTTRNVLRRGDENDWHRAEDIRLLAQLAALLHDLGKASVAFQARLRGQLQERNLYRHEWVSLRLFQAFVGQDDDAGWLRRLSDPDDSDTLNWTANGRYRRDGLDINPGRPFEQLPPLAAAIAWLILTHHRLPLVPVADEKGAQDWLGRRARSFNPVWLEAPLSLVGHDWNEVRQPTELARIEPYWNPAGPLPVAAPAWRAQAARLAKRLAELRGRRDDEWLGNPYVTHLARLSLMLADHAYSRLGLDKNDQPVPERRPHLQTDAGPMANTTRNQAGTTVLNQSLVEHLLGVAHSAGLIAHALPGFERYLPRLAQHRGLRKRSADPRFAWQDKAADAATALREAARAQGAFIVNMASTGCGKTLGNARILYALADPQHGLRATYALGLRALTLQTGRSYQTDLHLREDELAIRVGGSASQALFDYYQQKAESRGSASVQSLLEEDSHVLYDGTTADHPLLSRALHDPEIRKLLSAPMLVCTVDHMVPATESLRAGRQIAPMLRLMSADLILDELDDYALEDLPALTRLVHWAGMLGTRVLLSSATLPPALLEGMYAAYRAGRMHYQRNRGADGGNADTAMMVPCLWADEFGVQTAACPDAASFAQQHLQFVGRRATRLQKAEPLRRGALLPLQLQARQREQMHAEFAEHVRTACLDLHAAHAQADPVSGKHVSFGLVRMANIDPLFDVAQALFLLGAPEDTRIHLCVYHARFPLLQRSAIEKQLDAAFDRRGDGLAVYRLPAIRAALDACPEQQQLFIVLASPVCEVGRDWDADWAVAEPSSMRSLIQLAGRVQRHRGTPGTAPNVLIFDTNLRHFRQMGQDAPAFVHPGFEQAHGARTERFRLQTHRLGELLRADEYTTLTALPRIQPLPQAKQQPQHHLADLEHARMADSMLPKPRTSVSTSARSAVMFPLDAACAWQYPQAALTGVLPQQQPFRDDPMPSTTLVLLPDEEEERLVLHRIEEGAVRRDETLYTAVERSQRHDVPLNPGPRIAPWGEFDLMALLAEQAEHLDLSLQHCAERLATVEVPESKQGWMFHPWLGFAKYK